MIKLRTSLKCVSAATACAWLCAHLVFLLAIPAAGVLGEKYIGDAKTSALAYLRMPVSARQAALGDAVSASEDIVANGYLNPAQAATVSGTRVMVSGDKLTIGRSHYALGLVQPLGVWRTAIGGGWVQFADHEIEERDINGRLTGQFNDLENTIAVWAATGITPDLFSGISLKYHAQSLHEQKARGISADAGLLVRGSRHLNFALVLRHLGWKFVWDSGIEDQLYPEIRGGLFYRPSAEYLSLYSDLAWTPGNSAQGHAGLEVSAIPELAVRAGIQGPNPILASAGFGLSFRTIAVDYAFSFHQSGLGHSHLLSLSLSWGGVKP